MRKLTSLPPPFPGAPAAPGDGSDKPDPVNASTSHSESLAEAGAGDPEPPQPPWPPDADMALPSGTPCATPTHSLGLKSSLPAKKLSFKCWVSIRVLDFGKGDGHEQPQHLCLHQGCGVSGSGTHPSSLGAHGRTLSGRAAMPGMDSAKTHCKKTPCAAFGEKRGVKTSKEKEGSGAVCWLGSVPSLCGSSTALKHSYNPSGGITVPSGAKPQCKVLYRIGAITGA